MLPLKFKNSDLFILSDKDNTKTYELFGLICYWGSHYVSFYKPEDENYWISCDDTVITKIENWKDLVTKCIKAHFHPTILFYRKSDSPFSTSTNDLKDQISEKEMNRMMEYCEVYHREHQSLYKSFETDRSRIRPNNEDKKIEDKEIMTKISMTMSRDNYENLDTETKEEEKKIKLQKMIKEDELKNTEQKFSKINELTIDKSLYIPSVKEDEWICENPKCQNINKNNSFECLSKIFF
jgi:hypothetical protein